MAKKRVILKSAQFATASADHAAMVRQLGVATQDKRKAESAEPIDPAVVIEPSSAQALKRFRKAEPATSTGRLNFSKGVHVVAATERATVSHQGFSVGRPATTVTELPKAKLKMIERLLVSLPRN
jgi:hypothetical protein